MESTTSALPTTVASASALRLPITQPVASSEKRRFESDADANADSLVAIAHDARRTTHAARELRA